MKLSALGVAYAGEVVLNLVRSEVDRDRIDLPRSAVSQCPWSVLRRRNKAWQAHGEWEDWGELESAINPHAAGALRAVSEWRGGPLDLPHTLEPL